MISGPAIDECRASMRNTQSLGFSTGKNVKEQDTRPVDESDEDLDPNDMGQESDGSDDESDTDYGSDY